jgi:hypothetical protein
MSKRCQSLPFRVCSKKTPTTAIPSIYTRKKWGGCKMPSDFLSHFASACTYVLSKNINLLEEYEFIAIIIRNTDIMFLKK